MSKKIRLLAAICAVTAASLLSGVIGCAPKTEEPEHRFSESWTVTASEHYRKCEEEGCEEVADKAAHTFDNGTVTTAPTFENDGVKTFACSVCGYEKTESVPKKEHVYSDEWQKNEEKHWHACTDEGYETLVKDEAAHTFDDGRITKEPTYDEDGVKTYACTVCGYEKTELLPRLHHDFSDKWSINEKKHWHACTDEGCSEIADEGTHTFDDGRITKEPDYILDGEKTYTCTVCGFEKKEAVPSLEHSYSEEWSYDEEEHYHACTDEGYENLKADKEAHDFGEWTIITRPTLTENGEKTRECTVCGYEEKTAAAFEEILEDYVTVQNADLGAGASVSSHDGTYSTAYSTNSVVYKVKVTSAGQQFGAIIRETAAWADGYTFLFDPNKGYMHYPNEDGVQVWTGDEQGVLFKSGDVLEIGAIDVKDAEKTYVFVKVNRERKIAVLTPKKSATGNWITIWNATFEQVDEVNYEDAVTVTNRELGMEDGFSTAGEQDNYAYFAYETENSTSSVIYKFNYTHGVTTFVGLRNAQGGWAGYQFVFVGGNIQYGVNGALQTKGGVISEGETYEVEIGAINVKNSDKVYIYVKLNGAEIASGYVTRLETEGAGVAIWGAGGSGEFGQV